MSTSAYSWLVGPMPDNPAVYQHGSELYDWNTGKVIPWKNERMLVRTESGVDYYTWVDTQGYRQWQIHAKV